MATVFYKDLSLDFTPHPVSGDIRPITDETAIRRAIANIIKTPKGTRPFRPDYGCDIQKYLFGNSIFTEYEVNRKIYESITKYEPRVDVISVTTKIDTNSMKIDTEYFIKNTGKISTLQTLVERAA